MCERVPAEPPRDFWEAVQSVRFMHLAAWKESSDRAEVPVGRIDQFWYPYYKADIESGKITRAQAAELIGAMWLKIREVENLVTIKREHRAAPGSQLPNVTLCGRDKDGNDLTNELSWMVLEVMAQIHLSEPAVYVRYHEDQDENFIIHALKCNREFGGGNPAFLNDELGTRRYLDRGVPIEDACNWNASGCLGYHLECAEHMAGAFNLVQTKVMEVTLHDGFDPRTGKQVGLHTGDLRNFTSIEQLYEAFLKQEDYFAEKMRDHYFIWWTTEIANSPMSGLRAGMLFRDCIPAGLASREGGCRYPEGKASWVGDKGVCDCADYMAAIQYLVFDEKKITMAQLLEAMDANWEGHEDIRQMCLKAPKYGNDDDYVDDWYVRAVAGHAEDPAEPSRPHHRREAHAVQGRRGRSRDPGQGRRAPCPTAASRALPSTTAAPRPWPGGDVNGPTALILSATKYPIAVRVRRCGPQHEVLQGRAQHAREAGQGGLAHQDLQQARRLAHPVQHPQRRGAHGGPQGARGPQRPARPRGRLQRLLRRSAARTAGRDRRAHHARGGLSEDLRPGAPPPAALPVSYSSEE